MTATRVTICNAALAMLGANSITSFDEKSDRARLCVALYDQARRAVLRLHPWNCATKRVTLAALAGTPPFGWGYALSLPADFIRVLSVSEREYAIESRSVLCNALSVDLKYIFDNQTESTWDDLLVEAMSLQMAAKLAKPITGSSTENENKLAELERLLKRARAVDAQEEPSQTLNDGYFSLLEVRY